MQEIDARVNHPGRPHFLVQLFGVVLVLAIVVGALSAGLALRNKEIEDWRLHLKSMSLLLTEHTANTLFTAYLVLDAITERVNQAAIQDEVTFRERMSTPEVHQLLREKIQGLPQLDVATIVAADGSNLNFSRTYPVPKINLSERDYFKAHRDNPHLGDFISTAVRNKGNGKWTFYLSRRINNARGDFLGLVLVGLSVDAFTGLYERLVSSLGDGASITLFRQDLTTLARAPRQDELVGKVNSGSTYQVIVQNHLNEAVVAVDTPRFSSGEKEFRLNAVRAVERYPLVVSLVVPEGIFLSGWRHSALMIAMLSALSVAFVIGGVQLITRSSKRREQIARELSESETKFHTMVDWATDWEYWLHVNGHVHYMTPSAETFTGYRVDEFERHPELIDQLIHPDDRERWAQLQARGASSGTEVASEAVDLRIVHKHGGARWVSYVARPVYGPSGECLGERVTMRDITDRKASENEIRTLAYYDALTGLPNRRLLMDRLSLALHASGSWEFSALMLLDLDHFKKLNDTQGHDVGDRLLVEVSRRLIETVRGEDTVARLGGDEFAVMMLGMGQDEAQAAARVEQLAHDVHAVLSRPYLLSASNASNTDYRSTPSIGVTLFRAGQDASLDVLMKRADVALYQAKDAGRNTIRFFSPEVQAAMDARIALETAMRQALLQNQFVLYYQPQVDVTGRWVGAEALIRWIEPVMGVVPPNRFIPVAEDTGLIIELGQWVLDSACAQLRRWSTDPRTAQLQLSVNVSARQFHQRDFVERVQRSIGTHGINPQRLMLELTESTVVEHMDEVVSHMERLHRLGVNFSLDDFGTGYSSLSYLKRLPLDEVKIDRSFVRDLVDDSNDAAIIRAILAMSESLGLRVVAEGVETPAQREFLVRNGCHHFQGFLFGKPIPIEHWDEAFDRQLQPESPTPQTQPTAV